MKNSRKLFVLTEVILSVLVIAVALIMIREKDGVQNPRVSVIVQNSDDDQWSAFRYGIEMAAQDEDIETFVVSTGKNMTVKEEEEIIEEEIENGADAVIIQPVPGDDINKILGKTSKKVPVMLIEQPVSKDLSKSEIPVTEPDNYAMGKVLAQELLEDYSGNIEGKALGILSGASGTEAVKNREQGFKDGIKDKGAKISWSVSEVSENADNNSLEAQTNVDIVIALDNAGLVLAGRSSAANNLHGALLYGIGNSTEAAYYLDTGAVECLVVPDEFHTGYQSMIEISKNLKKAFYTMKDRETSYTVIRRETLFSKENQEILFKMSQ